MSNEKKQLNEGYKPSDKVERGYQPKDNVRPIGSEPQGGHQPVENKGGLKPPPSEE